MMFRVYFERKKLVFNSKIDKFTMYNNKISDLRNKKTEQVKIIQGIDEKISNTVNEKLDYGIKYFLDREKRKELLENAEKYGYSPKKIDELRVFIDEWNQDCVTNDVLDSFKVLEEFVKNNQEPYKGNIMYRFSKILSNEGRNSNEN
jgi:hypothetical protein